MNITIAPIATSHVRGFHACLDTVAREKKYLAQIEALPLERIESFVRDSVANDSVQFVALDAERVIGWADILPAWAPAVSHCGSLGMGVLPEYRGRGIGRQLLEACIAKAWKKGIIRIELEARADNEHAIKLYENFGFIHEARKRQAMRFDGVYYDTIQMSLIAQSADTNVSGMIAIRKAHKKDAREIWDIRNTAINSQCIAHYSPAELEIWTSGEMTEQFVDVVEDSFYVATLDGRVVGTGMINLESGKVDAIFVHPSHMRGGIGRQILLHLEKLALDAGLTQLSLDSTLNAAPFYRVRGFVGDSVAKYESPRGISLDCIPMIKRLHKDEGNA